jgi:hypothetical protein
MRKLFSAALLLAGLAGTARMADADPPAAGCCAQSCPQYCAVCKAVTVPRVVVKPVYTDVCEEFCEPKCMSCGIFGGGCDSGCGPTHQCSTVKTRKVMVVKLKKCTECANACIVDHVPAAPCAVPCASCGAPVVQAVPQTLPQVAPKTAQPMLLPNPGK